MEAPVLDDDLWTREDVSDLDCACRLLASASCCIGVHDDLAQEMVLDVLKLLRRIGGRSALDLQPLGAELAGKPH